MTEHSTKIYLWPSSVLNTFVKHTPGEQRGTKHILKPLARVLSRNNAEMSTVCFPLQMVLQCVSAAKFLQCFIKVRLTFLFKWHHTPVQPGEDLDSESVADKITK